MELFAPTDSLEHVYIKILGPLAGTKASEFLTFIDI